MTPPLHPSLLPHPSVSPHRHRSHHYHHTHDDHAIVTTTIIITQLLLTYCHNTQHCYCMYPPIRHIIIAHSTTTPTHKTTITASSTTRASPPPPLGRTTLTSTPLGRWLGGWGAWVRGVGVGLRLSWASHMRQQISSGGCGTIRPGWTHTTHLTKHYSALSHHFRLPSLTVTYYRIVTHISLYKEDVKNIWYPCSIQTRRWAVCDGHSMRVEGCKSTDHESDTSTKNDL